MIILPVSSETPSESPARWVRSALAMVAGRPDEIAALVLEALAALERADLNAATATLEYALRKHPSDLGLLFALGEVRLLAGDPRASEPLELLAQLTDWREVWIRLAVVRSRFGSAHHAALELHRALSRSAPLPGAGFQAFADLIVQQSGAAGWCGLDNSGRLVIGATASSTRVSLDRRACHVRRPARSGDGPSELRLPKRWAAATLLSVEADGQHLIGSPISIPHVTAVDGFVEAINGGLRGWCWFPGERDRVPDITIISRKDPRQRVIVRAEKEIPVGSEFHEFATPLRFTLPASAIPGETVDVLGPHGRRLYGSPLDALQEARQAASMAKAVARAWPATRRSDVRRLRPETLIIIPVYRGLEPTMACIESVLGARAEAEDILVIADASPDRDLLVQLGNLAAAGAIRLDVQDTNRGFPGTANIGLRAAAGRDVVLLNSDTLVVPDWLKRLRAVAHSAPDIGTVTPLSNDATIFSYPHRDGQNAIPELESTRSFAEAAYEANGNTAIGVPTGHGFCLYIRNSCLAQTGVLREDVFAQGYGEENDFCLRAAALGWRNVAAPGLFIAHIGSQSFGPARTSLQKRNLEALNRIHPGYDRAIAKWKEEDPLAESRRRLDAVRWRRMQGSRPAIVFVTHNRGGGVQQHVAERAADCERNGRTAIILRPGPAKDCSIATAGNDFPNLRFAMPLETDELLTFLAGCQLERLEIHHFIGHHPGLIERLCGSGVPYHVVAHDYSWFCARSTLTRGDHRYCGEPDVASCVDCVADHGATIEEDITPAALRERSAKWLVGAASVIMPSADTAWRFRRHFDIAPVQGVWEDETKPLVLAPVLPIGGRRRRICLAGAIGPEKGYDTVLQCARLIATRQLPLELVVVGYTSDDRRLREAGVRITGPYAQSEAVDIIRAQRADIAFLPGRLPETWSYVLSQLWRAGLPVVAFDIGSPAERIRARKGGFVVPLHLPVDRLVKVLMSLDTNLLGAAG